MAQGNRMDNVTQKIKELQKQGLTLRAIAREVGLSHVAVMKRLKRDKASGNQNGNQQCSSPANPVLVEPYLQKRLCKNWESCSVCQLGFDKLKELEELYVSGCPVPVLATYFSVPPKVIRNHAFLLNLHKMRAKQEDPRRKEVVREALENEVWQTIMSSEASGSAGDRIAAMKLAAQIQGIGDGEGKGQGVGPGVVVNMRFSLNSGDSEDQSSTLVDLGTEDETGP